MARKTQAQDLESLGNQWIRFKQAEKLANEQRLAIEQQIIEMTGYGSEKGTGYLNLSNGNTIKVYTGEETDYDQRAIDEVAAKWADLMKGIEFPFKKDTWRPDKQLIAAIKELYPKEYIELIEPTMVVKTKKPSFSIK